MYNCPLVPCCPVTDDFTGSDTDLIHARLWDFNTACLLRISGYQDELRKLKTHIIGLENKFDSRICLDNTHIWNRLSFHFSNLKYP